MKPQYLVMAAITSSLLFVSGCRTMTISELTKNYRVIEPGMTEKEVTAILGVPKRSVEETVRWEAYYGPQMFPHFVRVDIVFDEHRRVLAKKIAAIPSNNPVPEPLPHLPQYDRNTGRDTDDVLSREAGI